MAFPGLAFPGLAVPGLSVPGYAGPPAGIPGQGTIITTAPVLLAASAATGSTTRSGTCRFTNGAATIYLGGAPHVTAASGLPVPPTATLDIPLYPGDQLWAVTASGTSTVYAWQTGA